MMRKIKNFVLLSLITVVCLFGLSAVSACTEPVDGYTIMNNYIIQPTLRYELYTLYASNAEVNGFTFSTDKSEGIVAVGDSFKKVNITNGNGILKISYDDTEIIVDDAFMSKNKEYERFTDFWSYREIKQEREKQKFSAFVVADKLFILSSGFSSVKNDGTGYVPPTLYRYDLADGKLYYNSFLQGFKDSEEVRAADTFKVRCPGAEFVADGVKYYYEKNKLYIMGYKDYLGSVDTELNLPSRISNVVVKEIKTGAFKGLNGVETIKLPEELEEVSLDILQDCPALKKVTIGQRLSGLNAKIFYGSNNLEEIKVSVNNPNLCDEDGVLYKKNKKLLICYPAGKTFKNYTVNDACKELSNYAFSQNESLESLNLNNVEILNYYAVNECHQLSNVMAPKAYIVYSDAILDTKFTDETEDIILGRVLYKKTSAGETVTVGGSIERIAAYAFADNKSVKKIVLGKRVKSISDYAFKGCSALENIEVYNLYEVVSFVTGALDGVSANLSIKVPRKYLESYKTDRTKYWVEVADKITTLDKNSVKYIVGGNVVNEVFVDYADEIGEDYNYICGDYCAQIWKNESGTKIKSYYTVTNDIVLYGELKPITYVITYVTNGGKYMDTDLYNVENDFELLEATRTGYTFKGWYTSPDLAEESKIDMIIRKGTKSGDFTVYAQWEANEYSVHLDSSDSHYYETYAKVVFGTTFSFGVPTNSDRVFKGWRNYEGVMYTDENGNGLFEWKDACDVQLYAVWADE